MIGLRVVLLTFFYMESMVLLLWGTDAILGNGYEIYGQNFVALLQESEISIGFHYRGFDIRYLVF